MSWRNLKLGNSLVLAALYMDNRQPGVVAIGRNQSMWNYIFIGDTDVKTATSFDYYKISALKLKALYTTLLRQTHYGEILKPDDRDVVDCIREVANLGKEGNFSLKDALKNLGRFLSTKSYVSHIRIDRAKALKIVSTDLKVPLHVVEKYFGSVPESAEGDIRVGNSVLFFPENARSSNVDALKALVENIYADLKAKGLGKLFNGPIRFVKALGNVLGYYDLKSKDIKILYGASNSEQAKYTVMHEYGHKYFYEFIPDKKDLIRAKYIELRNAGKSSADTESHQERILQEEKFANSLKVGDVFICSRRGKYKGEWKVSKIGQEKKDTKGGVEFRIQLTKIISDDPNVKVYFAPTISGPPEVFLNDDWTPKDKKLAEVMHYKTPKKHELGETKEWFPTKYSEKNESEWFAELFSFYMRGNLKGEPAQFMKELVH